MRLSKKPLTPIFCHEKYGDDADGNRGEMREWFECPVCASELDDGENFCRACGQELDVE